MYKPRLRKAKSYAGSITRYWVALQDGYYAVGTTPKQSYDKLKKTYDYYHSPLGW